MNLVTRTLACVLFGSILTGTTSAATLYVDQSFGPGGDGSPEAPYDSIQDAIDDFNSSEIIVYPGIYTENIHITKDLRIAAYDGPNTTQIDGSLREDRDDSILINQSVSVKLEGLGISSGLNGIKIDKDAELYMRNCIICSNEEQGLYAPTIATEVETKIVIYNCVFVANGLNGVAFWADSPFGSLPNHPPHLFIRNTMFVSNGRYGIENLYDDPTPPSPDRIHLDYNNSVGNILGPYDPVEFSSGNYETGEHSISEAPDFVGGPGTTCNKDFRLQPTSVCIDAGDPGIGFLDPDGSVNDIGAYGGPGAQNFYTNPNDGPMIREVRVPQGMVPQGETFTIEATGAVR